MVRLTGTLGRNKNGVDPFLEGLGLRVRAARAERGMTRKILSRDSGVSERYLAQLEAGRGNVSVLVLKRIAEAMAMRPSLLLRGSGDPAETHNEALDLLGRLSSADLVETVAWLREKYGGTGKAMRIGLIGLRGAGKTTIGRILADSLGFHFIEVNRLIERDYGGSLDDLFSLAGQPAYRRYEFRCLERALEENEKAIIATGGGIIANDKAFGALLSRSHTIWIKASPEEHMARVVAQGDMRPMANNREAMRDLRLILSAREAAYARAEATLDTTGQDVDESVRHLKGLLRELL